MIRYRVYVKGREKPFFVQAEHIECGEQFLRFIKEDDTIAEFQRCEVQAWEMVP